MPKNYPADGQKGYDWREPFLDSYANHGIIGKAATEVGVSRQAVHYRMRNDVGFAGAMWGVRYINAGRLYDKAMKLALEGTEDPIVYRGEIIGYRTIEYPAMILKMLERFDPEGFGPNTDAEKVDPLTRVTFLPPRGIEDNPTVGPEHVTESE